MVHQEDQSSNNLAVTTWGSVLKKQGRCIGPVEQKLSASLISLASAFHNLFVRS